MAALVNAITTQATANGTSYTSAAFTPAASDYLLVFVHASDTTVDGTLTDSQSLGWTKLSGIVSNTNNRFVVFKSDTTAAASSMTVTWDCTGDAATGSLLAVMRVSGSNGNIRQIANNAGAAASTPSVVFSSSCLTSSAVVFATANRSNPHGNTVPSGFTARNGAAYNTPTTGVATSASNSGFTSNTITAGGLSGTDWTVFGVEVYGSAHETTGTLSGQGSSISGSSNRLRSHATTGALPGLSAEIAGSASRSTSTVTHATSGTLSSQGAAISGASEHRGLYATSGAIIGTGSGVDGSATRYRSHATDGTLSGQGSAVNGASTRFRSHSVSGALSGQVGTIDGSSVRFRTHETSATLVGQSSILSGSADRTRRHEVTGEIIGSSGTIAGSFERIRIHGSAGAISGAGSIVAGSAGKLDTVIPSDIVIMVSYKLQGIEVDLAQPVIESSYKTQTIKVRI